MWCGIVDTGTVDSKSKKHMFILNWLALTKVTMNLLHYLPKSQMGSMVVHVDELMKCMTISSGCGHTQYIHLVNDLSGLKVGLFYGAVYMYKERGLLWSHQLRKELFT